MNKKLLLTLIVGFTTFIAQADIRIINNSGDIVYLFLEAGAKYGARHMFIELSPSTKQYDKMTKDELRRHTYLDPRGFKALLWFQVSPEGKVGYHWAKQKTKGFWEPRGHLTIKPNGRYIYEGLESKVDNINNAKQHLESLKARAK